MPTRVDTKKTCRGEWLAISKSVRAASGGRCECRGECGASHKSQNIDLMLCDGEDIARCRERNKADAQTFRGMVVLTVAHLDHNARNNDRANLRAFCQRCHLAYDHHQHASTRPKSAKKKAQRSSEMLRRRKPMKRSGFSRRRPTQ